MDVKTISELLAEKLPRVKGSTGVSGNWLYSVHSDLAERFPDIPAPHKYPTKDSPEYYKISPNRAFCCPFISDVAFLLASDAPNRIERARKRIRDALPLIGREQMLLALDAGENGLLEDRLDIPSGDRENTLRLTALGIAYFVAGYFIRSEIIGDIDQAEDIPDYFLREQAGRSPLLSNYENITMGLNVGWIFTEMMKSQNTTPCFSRKSKVLESLAKLIGAAYARFSIAYSRLRALLPEISYSIADTLAEIKTKRRYSLWPGITDITWQEKGLEGLSIYPCHDGVIHALLHVRDDNGPINYFMALPGLKQSKYEGFNHEREAAAIVLEAIRMCVVPGEEKIRGNRVPEGYVKNPSHAAPKDAIRVTYVPRVRYVTRNEDSNAANNTGTGSPKRAHQVGGFLRQLPAEWRASHQARSLAAEIGLELPEKGVTFVRPHIRGNAEIAPHAKRTVRVRR